MYRTKKKEKLFVKKSVNHTISIWKFDDLHSFDGDNKKIFQVILKLPEKNFFLIF